jgi:hypothetical protein
MGKHKDVIAREATGEERSRLWAEITQRTYVTRFGLESNRPRMDTGTQW